MQVLYNVTIIIDHSAHDEWFTWMKEVHIPDVMNTGCFIENKMLKLNEEHNPDGATYAIQYIAKSMEIFNEYELKHAPRLRSEVDAKFGGKYGAFRTLLNVV